LARGLAAGTLPPFFGIRVKALTPGLKLRAVRTLDLFLGSFAGAVAKAGCPLPSHLFATLPKVTAPAQVGAFAEILGLMEQGHRLPPGCLRLEAMIETPEILLGPDGGSPLPQLPAAASGRLAAVHFGAYDYTASLGIAAAAQSMDHPACDVARHLMTMAFAGTSVALADGATNVLPVGRHRPVKGGAPLTAAQIKENAAVVRRAWRLSYQHIRHSLRLGLYQGWDLHPAQIPVRYGACYAFFREGLEAATARLRGFMDSAAQATRRGEVFDDAATGQGLLNFFLRGLSCGAIAESEVTAAGLSVAELRSRSFSEVVRGCA
jgi:hypothetical protein